MSYESSKVLVAKKKVKYINVKKKAPALSFLFYKVSKNTKDHSLMYLNVNSVKLK